MTRNCKPEALVQREILLAVGREPSLLVASNEVGVGHPAAVRSAMQAALAPFGPAVVATALSVLRANMTRWGLGVGSPDLVGSYDGHAFGWEVKAEDGRVSDDQLRWHAAARKRGMTVEVVRSVEDAQRALESMRVGKQQR